MENVVSAALIGIGIGAFLGGIGIFLFGIGYFVDMMRDE